MVKEKTALQTQDEGCNKQTKRIRKDLGSGSRSGRRHQRRAVVVAADYPKLLYRKCHGFPPGEHGECETGARAIALTAVATVAAAYAPQASSSL